MDLDVSKQLGFEAVRIMKRHGVEFGDIRFVRNRSQTVRTEDRRVEQLSDNETYGFGVRVICSQSWGFAGSNRVTPEEVEKVTRLAIGIANASATVKKGDGVSLLPQEPQKGSWRTEVAVDPFKIPLDEKIDLLICTADGIFSVKGVAKAAGHMGFIREQKLLISTEGAEIETDVTTSMASIMATATQNGEAKSRTYYPPSQTKGYELIREAGLVDHAVRVGSEAVEHLQAAECSAGEKDIILMPSHLCLTIHESVGHATELDRVLGMEESLAGRSFATPDKINKLQYGSKIVNFKADNTLPGGLATTGYDDGGVPGKAWHIVNDGTFVGYSTNREVGGAIGAKTSVGCSRADSWRSIPIVRIPNLSLEPGKERISLDDLIAGTKDGILIDEMGSFSIDQMRYNFQFGGDAFWEIKNGRKTRMLKNVIYQSITTDFWNSCDAICDDRFWRPFGILNCGKGDPVQTARMTHGSSPARFRNIKVGGIKP